MKQRMISVIAICAAAALTGPAFADCAEDLAQLRGEAGTGAGISKDGSLAPLEDDSADTGAADAPQADATTAADAPASGEGENEIAKDGSETPLGTDTSSVATSGQDAEAQQDGATAGTDATAEGEMSPEKQDALARAEAALAAGDEAGCMAAVEEARSL